LAPTARGDDHIGGGRKIVGIIVTREEPPNPRPVAIAPAGITRGNVGGARLMLGRTLVGMVDAIVAGTMIGAWRDAATLMLLSLEAFLLGLRTPRADDRDGCPLGLA
jgi:hypothetical protein